MYICIMIDKVEIECVNCGDMFGTYTDNGMPFDYCCSQECYKKYHSKENIRDRKIDYILFGLGLILLITYQSSLGIISIFR